MKSVKKPIAIALILSIITISCSEKSDTFSSFEKRSITNDFSGEEIFKGIFFFENQYIIDNIKTLKEISNVISNSENITNSMKSMSETSTHFIKYELSQFFQFI